MRVEARINEQGQLELPQVLRDELHLAPGSIVEVSVVGDGLRVQPKLFVRTPEEMKRLRQARKKYAGTMPFDPEKDSVSSMDEYMGLMRGR